MVGDVESVAFVFTRPVFEVRQAEQDGGGNIYMAGGIFAACTRKCLPGMSLLQLTVKMLRWDRVWHRSGADEMDVRRAKYANTPLKKNI